MRKLLLTSMFTSSCLLATSANAAVIIDSLTPGQAFSINYTGQVNGGSTNLISSVQDFVFTGATNGNTTYNFSYTLTNDSSVASRLRSFGFDVTAGGSVSGGSAGGAYANVGFNDNFPEGVGTLDICFRANGGNNCTGGPNGLTQGQVGVGTFSIDFAAATSSITLDNFTTRYQSINPAINNSTSGVGIGSMGGVPEPATWGMLIFGFGAIGGAMRRRPSASRKIKALA